MECVTLPILEEQGESEVRVFVPVVWVVGGWLGTGYGRGRWY